MRFPSIVRAQLTDAAPTRRRAPDLLITGADIDRDPWPTPVVLHKLHRVPRFVGDENGWFRDHVVQGAARVLQAIGR